MIIKILFKWSVFNTVSIFLRVAFLRAFVVNFIRAFLRSGCPSQDTLTLLGKWPARRNWATPWLGNTQMCWDNGRFSKNRGELSQQNGQSNNPIELIPHHTTIHQSVIMTTRKGHQVFFIFTNSHRVDMIKNIRSNVCSTTRIQQRLVYASSHPVTGMMGIGLG